MQRQLRLTNACAFACIILQRCFKAARIETKIIYGSTPCSNFTIPHVWLTIDGHIVDNTFIEHISEEDLLLVKSQYCYIDKEPTEYSNEYFLGDESTRRLGNEDHNIKLFKWILTNPDKAFAISHNKPQIQDYYKMITLFMKTKYQADVLDFAKCDSNCWGCNKDRVELKKCSRCKIAKYCSKQCQKTDWKDIHKLACLLPGSF